MADPRAHSPDVFIGLNEAAPLILNGLALAVDTTVYQTELPDRSGYHARAGLAEFQQGHIPNGIFLDAVDRFRGPDRRWRFDPPGQEIVRDWCAANGIGETTNLILYDRRTGSSACWAHLMVRRYGIRSRILKGGYQEWVKANLPLSTGFPPVRVASPLPLADRGGLVGKGDVLAAVTSGDVQLVNALGFEEFEGHGGIHYGRPGRIPGSKHLPPSSVLDGASRLKPAETLVHTADEAGIALDRPIIVYCGAGFAASVVALALEQAGAKQVSLYAPSLQEWAADPACPLEVSQPNAVSA